MNVYESRAVLRYPVEKADIRKDEKTLHEAAKHFNEKAVNRKIMAISAICETQIDFLIAFYGDKNKSPTGYDLVEFTKFLQAGGFSKFSRHDGKLFAILPNLTRKATLQELKEALKKNNDPIAESLYHDGYEEAITIQDKSAVTDATILATVQFLLAASLYDPRKEEDAQQIREIAKKWIMG
ncbi:hypothetical protein [Heliorestis convoluta]|uniref:Uncharacterized protein n=1 Tax=Heliorestis convoluta TaxID=356322 RepID=A0A5Q2N0P6_9FIRM|nr:hypothetical protein [Heliorestis convoluta]QGG47369.1 hypothetical protein FTV88_1222 [Heliorestis convoluta]